MAELPGFERQRAPGVLTIEAYVGTGYRVGGRDWPRGVLVTPGAAFAFETLDLAGFAPLAEVFPKIEVLLIGTGAAMVRPPADLLEALRAAGYSTEFMASRAAARTYNVLVGEGRQVAAALLPG